MTTATHTPTHTPCPLNLRRHLTTPTTWDVVIPPDYQGGPFCVRINADFYYAEPISFAPGSFLLSKELENGRLTTEPYTVTGDDMGGSCTCPGWRWKRGPKCCKHTVAVCEIVASGLV